MEVNGIWLPITDYSEYRDISVSTVRRYIKGGQVKYKKEKGKYFVFVSEENYQRKQGQRDREVLELKLNIEELKTKLRTLEEENNDLRMLVKLYENKRSQALPPLPRS